METNIVELGEVKKLVGDDPAYLKEFSRAAVISFTEFRNNYTASMYDRDLEKLREAGHKIKPAAKMIGLTQVISEYENAKKLLNNGASEEKVQASIERQQAVCNQIINDFNQQINNVPGTP